MYIDHKENENDPGTRFCLNANRADIANVALNLNNITTETNVPVYFNNGTPSQIIEIPNSLIGDLSDKYLSVTKGGTVNGNITANTFIGDLQGEADTAKVADYAESANYSYYSSDATIAIRALTTGAITYSYNDITPEIISQYLLQKLDGYDISNVIGTSIDIVVTDIQAFGQVFPQALSHFKIGQSLNDATNPVLMWIISLLDHQEDKIAYNEYVRISTYNSEAAQYSEWSDWMPYGIIPDNEEQKDYLPLTAGEEYKISGPLGFTEASYGSMLPETGFEGQLFFLEDDNSSTLPSGGSAGQALVKNSTADGDASWKDIVALPKGGSAGQVLIKNSTTDGDASWSTRLNAINHLGAVGVYSRSDIGYSPNFDDPGVNGLFEVRGNNETPGESGIKPYNTFLPMLNLKTPDNIAMLQLAGNNNVGFFIRGKQAENVTMADTSWKRLWMDGDAVTGAVWNDYAEYRESDCEEFGYVLMENGDDTLSKTTERLSHFAGISSDTWGFSQGETDKAKTPIAVAGRVLAYPYQDRNNYKPGDCVCAAPGGTIDIMTREEVINWPDRIVGTVSCVPDYEEWGGGENADRPPVRVNGRIWIKIK